MTMRDLLIEWLENHPRAFEPGLNRPHLAALQARIEARDIDGEWEAVGS